MDKTLEAWKELREQFNHDQEELYKAHCNRLTAIDDAYREGIDEREERRCEFIAKIKREAKEANARYVKERRGIVDDYRLARKRLENARQMAYAEFRAEHKEIFD